MKILLPVPCRSSFGSVLAARLPVHVRRRAYRDRMTAESLVRLVGNARQQIVIGRPGDIHPTKSPADRSPASSSGSA
jgi:hypothetical protein